MRPSMARWSLEASTIFITKDIEQKVSSLRSHGGRVVVFYYEDEFLIEHSREVVAEAYVAEEEMKYIVLASKKFNEYAQNALLKIVEEPPRNICFFIVAPSRDALLPTVRSRLAIKIEKREDRSLGEAINFSKNSLSDMFEILKSLRHAKRDEAKVLIEDLLAKLTKDGVVLSSRQLEGFSLALRALHLNASVQPTVAMLFASLLAKK